MGCTWTQLDGSNYVTESDSRLNSSVTWINGLATGKYDTWHVMAHELGHTLGFQDTTDSRDNVMYMYVYTDDTTNHRLGKGDADGNNSKY